MIFYEQNYDHGFPVSGVARTLTASVNGQAEKLYITAKPYEIEFDENEVNQILNNYAPGNISEMLNVKNGRQIADELIKMRI